MFGLLVARRSALVMVLLCVIILMFVRQADSAATAAPDTADLPPGWENHCATADRFVDWNITTLTEGELSGMKQVHCGLSGNSTLDFMTFRQWTAMMDPQQKVALEVQCTESSTFLIPWPMKAKNLVFLRIVGCTMLDYFQEYFDSSISSIEDELRVLEIKNAVVPMDIFQLIQVVENYSDVVLDSYCGPLTVEKLALNGIVYEPSLERFPLNIPGPFNNSESFPDDFLPPVNQSELMGDLNMTLNEPSIPPFKETFNISKLSDDLENLIQKFLLTNVEHKCDYNHLRLLDESDTTAISSIHVEQIKMNSRFPELLVYNLSGIGLTQVPSELINWRSFTHFPKLTYLDLSHNNITRFEFVDHDTSTAEPGVINLQNNNISELSTNTLTSLLGLRSAFVRLENNPIDCSCHRVTPLLHFLQVNSMLGRYEYLRALTCASPVQFQGVEVGKLNREAVCRSDIGLPTGWEQYCGTGNKFVDWQITTLTVDELNGMKQIHCRLGESSTLDFMTFRQWTEMMDPRQKVALEVKCTKSAAFHLPWPMKAKNLVFLRIVGCTMWNYFQEYFDSRITEIEDELRVLEIKNSVVPIDIFQLAKTIKTYTHIVFDSYCGPLTAEKLAFNGIVYEPSLERFPLNLPGDFNNSESFPGDFLTPVNQSELMGDLNMTLNEPSIPPWEETFNISKLSDDLENLIQKFLFTNVEHKCDYSHLRLLDESNTTAISSVHVEQIKMNSRFPELLVYNLSGIGITQVPSELINWRGLTHFPKLKYLDLSHNNITRFEFVDHDTSTADPGIINLKSNNINELSTKTLNSLRSLRTAFVRLEDNPIDCSCRRVLQFYHFLQENPVLGTYEYLRKLPCASPEQFVGLEVGKLEKNKICPKESPIELIVLSSALGATLGLLLVVSILLIRYRREVIIIAYTRLHIKLPCQKTPALPEKEFDVFVSSCADDRQWVEENVIAPLNTFKRRSFTFCLKENWEYGVPIADMVSRSVESSVHTLAVISSQSLEDEWLQLEFSLALHQSLQEKRRHLVVVFKDDVSKRDLVPEMRKYVATTPCIHFSRRLYRDRLIYALTHGEKHNEGSRGASVSNSNDCPLVTLGTRM